LPDVIAGKLASIGYRTLIAHSRRRMHRYRPEKPLLDLLFLDIRMEHMNGWEVADNMKNDGKLIVVGTTSLRTMESLYYIGRKLCFNPEASLQELMVGQWEPYDEADDISPKQALQSILSYLDRHRQERLMTATQIIIVPGYHFHYADAIITNFHQPQSTLLLLIAAFVGDEWQKYMIMHCTIITGS